MDTLPKTSTPVTPLPPLPTAAASGSEVASLRRTVNTLEGENKDLKDKIERLKKRVAESAATGAPPSKKARTPGQKKKLFVKW